MNYDVCGNCGGVQAPKGVLDNAPDGVYYCGCTPCFKCGDTTCVGECFGREFDY